MVQINLTQNQSGSEDRRGPI